MNARSSDRRRALVTLAGVALGGPVRAEASFPQRAITIVVPFAAGGIGDLTARAIGEALARSLGQAVVIDNKPSAGSIVATQAVLGAKPDGHTLLLLTNGHAVSAGLFRKLPYDLATALAPIGLIGWFDLGLFTGPTARSASLAAWLAEARTRPGQLNIGTITPGSTQHLAAKLFEATAGIEAVVVPYRGSPALLAALRSGEVDLAVEFVGPMLPQLTAGSVKLLAIGADRRNPALPDVPTVQQAGLAGYQVASWNGLAAPTGTPAAVVERLARALQEAQAQPAVRDRLAPLGVRLESASPADVQRLLNDEIRRWTAVIRAAKIEPE